MSDVYGIGAAMQAAIRQYSESHRGTGRSTRLLWLVRDRDVIVFASKGERKNFRMMMDSSGRNPETVEMIVCNSLSFEPLLRKIRGTAQGRVWFDHSYLEQVFTQQIKDLCGHLDKVVEDLSGYGHRHLVTRDQASDYPKELYCE